MKTKCYLFRKEHIPAQAAFPVIDAHNHLWGDWNVGRVVEIMDTVGVISYCDLTANVHIEMKQDGYTISRGRIEDFFERCVAKYPARFYGFTMANFAQPVDEPLFTDVDEFIGETVETLRRHVALGVRGLKILKELGLLYRDGQGKLINIDDSIILIEYNKGFCATTKIGPE